MNTSENEAFRQSKNEETYQSIHEYPQAKNRKQNLYIELLTPPNTRTPCKPNKYIINSSSNKQNKTPQWLHKLEKQWSKKLNYCKNPQTKNRKRQYAKHWTKHWRRLIEKDQMFVPTMPRMLRAALAVIMVDQKMYEWKLTRWGRKRRRRKKEIWRRW